MTKPVGNERPFTKLQKTYFSSKNEKIAVSSPACPNLFPPLPYVLNEQYLERSPSKRKGRKSHVLRKNVPK